MSTYAPHQNVPMWSIFCTYLIMALHMQTAGINPQAQAQAQAQVQAQAWAQAQDLAQDQSQARAQAPDQVCRLPVLIKYNNNFFINVCFQDRQKIQDAEVLSDPNIYNLVKC